MNKQIIIVGFMGAGKTSVARELASRLECPAVDLDELITEREGRSPAQIIDADGESYFRELESQTLREALGDGGSRVIALGGGAWTAPRNRQMVTDHGAFIIWLDAPFDVCWKRIEAGLEARPLAPSREPAAQLYSLRRPIYECCDVRVEIMGNETVADVTAKVLRGIS